MRAKNYKFYGFWGGIKAVERGAQPLYYFKSFGLFMILSDLMNVKEGRFI